jgi:Zn-finger nucleic acid-binding protein
MDAAALTCPQCGAAAGADAIECSFCHARLATTACASCFGLVFLGSRHCVHCGVAIAVADTREGERACPRGCGMLQRLALGGVELDECPRCSGVWLDAEVFRRLCAEEERRAVFLGAELQAMKTPAVAASTVRYVPCPDCTRLMNRVNFGKRSGIIVDGCSQHGTWFDADELRRVVEWVRDGGLDRARTHERRQLEEERRLLATRQKIAAWGTPQAPRSDDAGSDATGGVAAALLRLFGTT